MGVIFPIHNGTLERVKGLRSLFEQGSSNFLAFLTNTGFAIPTHAFIPTARVLRHTA